MRRRRPSVSRHASSQWKRIRVVAETPSARAWHVILLSPPYMRPTLVTFKIFWLGDSGMLPNILFMDGGGDPVSTTPQGGIPKPHMGGGQEYLVKNKHELLLPPRACTCCAGGRLPPPAWRPRRARALLVLFSCDECGHKRGATGLALWFAP